MCVCEWCEVLLSGGLGYIIIYSIIIASEWRVLCVFVAKWSPSIMAHFTFQLKSIAGKRVLLLQYQCVCVLITIVIELWACLCRLLIHLFLFVAAVGHRRWVADRVRPIKECCICFCVEMIVKIQRPCPSSHPIRPSPLETHRSVYNCTYTGEEEEEWWAHSGFIKKVSLFHSLLCRAFHVIRPPMLSHESRDVFEFLHESERVRDRVKIELKREKGRHFN